ncbi:MAG: hypothetical protein ACRBBR_03080 [Cellvibrionaceae bacterium]
MIKTVVGYSSLLKKRYWQAFLSILASIFIVWHALAIIIGPAPGSYLMSKVYPIFKPYLVALHLNNEWGFFAPDPAKGTLLRYSVTDENGVEHVFKLTENLRRRDHTFLRYTSLYLTIGRNNEAFVASAKNYLCRQHADLNPRQLQFFMGHQLSITPDEIIEGHRALDDQHMQIEYLNAIDCEPKS